jgi:hypothetical protein
VIKAEAGLELGFIHDKLLFSTSFYRNRTNNQLVGFVLPYITGASSVQGNLPAIIQNTGWEFTVSSVNIRNVSFSWTTHVNLSIPRNKLVSYPDIEHSPYAQTYAIGRPLSVKFIYHYTGVDPEKGTYTFASKKGTGIPNISTDRFFSSVIMQSLYGGISNQFEFKGFRIDVFFQFVKQKGFSILQSVINAPGDASNIPTSLYEGRWRRPGDNAAKMQRLTKGNNFDALSAASLIISSDGWIDDASFVRMKNLSFSYQLPDSWRSKAHVQAASIYIQCQNLFTITNYGGLDPESGGLSLPPFRMITAGLQLTF